MLHRPTRKINIFVITIFFITINIVNSITLADLHKSWFQRLTSIPLEAVLNNRRIITKYLGCLLKKTVCAPESRDFKILFPSILKEPCSKCTDEEKKALKKILAHVRKTYPDEWQQVMSMYDPGSQYQKTITSFIENTS